MTKLEPIAGILTLCAVASTPALDKLNALISMAEIGEFILRLFM